LRNFLWNKKAGNARRKLLAFLHFVRIKTMQNGKVDSPQFPIGQKSGQRRRIADCAAICVPPYPHFSLGSAAEVNPNNFLYKKAGNARFFSYICSIIKRQC